MHEQIVVVPRGVQAVFRLAALMTFFAVVMGSLVCATESGAACPTWPGCYPGQFGPQVRLNPLIEFFHRLVAATSTPTVLVAAILSRRLPRRLRLPRQLPWVALTGSLAAGFFGMLTILVGLPRWAGMLDLFGALGAMLAMAVATVCLEVGQAAPLPARGADLLGVAIKLVIVMHLLGIAVAGQSSFTRCMGWPMWGILGTDYQPWLQGVRVGLAAVALVLIVLGATRVWPRTPRLVLALDAALVAEQAVGFVLRTQHAMGFAALYSVLAVTILWLLGLTAARAGLPGPEQQSASRTDQLLQSTGR